MNLSNLAIPWWVKLVPYTVIAALFAALMVTRSTLHNVRMDNALAAETVKATIAEQQAKWAQDGKAAAETYAKALADRQPIILRSTNEVTKYAQTPAGRAPCAAPDRVQGIDALDASLFPQTP